MSIDNRATNLVKARLLQIEQELSVKILYAAESGSRAWGFESADSDYDIRFIYVHRKNWYLNILPKRDVIEYPIVNDFDYSGWDLRKTLFLLNKSNPVLFEWLKSPVVYFKDDYFNSVMQELAPPYFSPISAVYHYLHMASGNYRQFLQTDEVKIKKYFYVLRPIMACMWIEKYKESPPMEFEKLLTEIQDNQLMETINGLLLRKKSGVEFGLEPRISIINYFIEEKMKHFEKSVKSFDPREKPAQNLLEEGFIRILDYCEANGLYLGNEAMEAIILIGIQASGKSTFYKEKFFNTHLRISNDLLKTKNREKLLLKYCKETNLSFVIDNTNISKEVRRMYIDFSKSIGIPIIGYYFRANIRQSLEWNSCRTGKECISRAGILGTYKKLELPSLEEGFDRLFYVEGMEKNFMIQEWKDEI